jgi:hypothetical protein
VTLTLADLHVALSLSVRDNFIHILWSLRYTQVSSAFLFGSAYMFILFSGFYAKEDGTSTPRLCPLFPSLSERPPKNNKSKF